MCKDTGDHGSHDKELHVSNRDRQSFRRVGKHRLPDPERVHGKNGAIREGLAKL